MPPGRYIISKLRSMDKVIEPSRERSFTKSERSWKGMSISDYPNVISSTMGAS